MNKLKVYFFMLILIICIIISGCSLQGAPAGSKDKNVDPMSIAYDSRCQGNGIRPQVTYTINANGATNVFLNTKVGVFFTTEMNPKTINESTFILKQGKRQVRGRVIYNGLGAVLTPNHELAPFTKYTAVITRKARDLAGNSLARDYVWSWTTGSGLDNTLPSVIHTVNPDGATDVFINTKITATFNKVMDVSTISASTASFMQGSTQVPGKWFYTGLSLVFIPAGNLAPNTQYTGTITTGVKDLAGNPLSRNFIVSWTTGSRLNTSIPYILYKTPIITRSISHGVLTVSATFSEPMDPLTVTTLNFMLKQGTTPVTGTVLYNDQTMTASFIPSVDLAPGTTYTATITTGVQNISGISLASDDVWSFTTSPAVGQVPINLGTAGNFAILAGSTVTNTGLTIVNGDIGLNPGISVTGFPPGILNGSLHLGDPTAIAAKLDLLAAFNDAAGRTGPNLVSSELGGTTLTPGLYNSAAGTFAITGILTLDAQDNTDAVFIFQAASTLVTAGNSSIILINGAQAKNIFWQVGSSATLGINSVIKGNILAQASITVSSGVTIDGRALALTAAVTLDTNTITSLSFSPSSSSSSSLSSVTSSEVSSITSSAASSVAVSSESSETSAGQLTVNLGTANNFAILAGSTITNTGLTIVNGDIGLNPGISVTGFPPGILNGSLHLGDPTAIAAKLDLLAAFNDAAGRTGPNLVSSELGGTTLTPGLYNSAAGTFAITGILTLDAQGNPDAVFIFQAASTLVTAGNSSIILINGAQAKNIFWQVGSSATLGINSVIKGNILAQASITVSSGVTIDGRALTQTAAVTLDTNIITMPAP